MRACSALRTLIVLVVFGSALPAAMVATPSGVPDGTPEMSVLATSGTPSCPAASDCPNPPLRRRNHGVTLTTVAQEAGIPVQQLLAMPGNPQTALLPTSGTIPGTAGT